MPDAFQVNFFQLHGDFPPVNQVDAVARTESAAMPDRNDSGTHRRTQIVRVQLYFHRFSIAEIKSYFSPDIIWKTGFITEKTVNDLDIPYINAVAGRVDGDKGSARQRKIKAINSGVDLVDNKVTIAPPCSMIPLLHY